MKIAAIQMNARTGEVDANLESARKLAGQAFAAGAEWVILPEFFTTAMAFHPDMTLADRPEKLGRDFLLSLAREHKGVAGGSFIANTGGDAVNRFFLAFPDGALFFHDKDQPTMWENAYYVGGHDPGVLDTPAARVGAALCWEFVRTRTAKRLMGKVDLVVGGSCWWSLPKKLLPGFPKSLARTMLAIMQDTPPRMARLLGVPVVHAAHCGEFSGRMPLLPGFPFESHLVGEAMIVDGNGEILARRSREQGEGFVLADLDLTRKHAPKEEIPQGFWIPHIPPQIRAVWNYQNLHGQACYHLRTRPARKKRDKAKSKG